MTVNTNNMSMNQMLILRAGLDNEIRHARIQRVMEAMVKLRKDASVHMAPGCAMLRLEKQLCSELAKEPMRNVFVDDVLDQLELVLDIEYE